MSDSSNSNSKSPSPSGKSTMPVPRPYVFVGQSQMLQELQALTKATLDTKSPTAEPLKITVLTGLGGIGKTELARKIAFECREFYKGINLVEVFWIDARTPESAHKDLAKWTEMILGPTLGDSRAPHAPVTKETEKDISSLGWRSKWEEMLLTLSKKGQRSLFIFDDCTPVFAQEETTAESDKKKEKEHKHENGCHPSARHFEIAPFLSYAASLETKPTVFVTSRYRDWKSFFAGINRPLSFSIVEMTGLTEKDGTELFQKTFDLTPADLSEFTPELHELFSTLGGHTLAHSLAIDWIWTKFQKKNAKAKVMPDPKALVELIRKCFQKYHALGKKAMLELTQSEVHQDKGLFPVYPLSIAGVIKTTLDEMSGPIVCQKLEGTFWKFLDLIAILDPQLVTVGLCCQIMEADGPNSDSNSKAKEEEDPKVKGHCPRRDFYNVLKYLGNSLIDIETTDFELQDCVPSSQVKIEIPRIVIEYLRHGHKKNESSSPERLLEFGAAFEKLLNSGRFYSPQHFDLIPHIDNMNKALQEANSSFLSSLISKDRRECEEMSKTLSRENAVDVFDRSISAKLRAVRDQIDFRSLSDGKVMERTRIESDLFPGSGSLSLQEFDTWTKEMMLKYVECLEFQKTGVEVLESLRGLGISP